MIRFSPWARACLVLLCLTSLVTRVNGEHLHICLDGDEPFASVHLHVDADDSGSQSTIGKPRHDFDVSLSSDALAKRLDATPGLLTLLVAALLLFAINVLRGAMLPLAREQYHPSASFSRLRPPLRGPPLLASV